ncbi:MAG: SDR family oxidoreductase [Pseudomonadota bacterium]
MKIFVTGACGYKGTVLVPKLLDLGHDVTAFDAMWFGNYLKDHKNLKVVQGDVRNIDEIHIKGYDAIIHLASVANDPCSDLDPKLTWEVSCLATMQLADKAVKSGIKQFIYASSGSVYGVKDEDQVTEELDLKPLSEYNKTKMVAERVLLSYSDDMAIQIVRPATVCGYSPRMRFDVSVNMLTMLAITKGEITVFGGKQHRPNIHMEDITNVYLHLLKNPQITGVYNAGFENLSILEIAERIAGRTSSKISITESNDPRSYRINSDKLLATGFSPKYTVDNAIQEVTELLQSGIIANEERFHNLKWMQKEILN